MWSWTGYNSQSSSIHHVFNESNVSFHRMNTFNFADDQKIGAIVRDKSDALKLQSAIDHFILWCHDSGLKVNRKKCNVMPFAMKNEVITYLLKTIHIIDRAHEIRDLGVISGQKAIFCSTY